MADKDTYKHYDSACFIEYAGPRVAMDVRCVPGKDDSAMVSFKMVADSRNQERFIEGWIEVNVSPFHAKAASYLQKGDLLHFVRGRFAVREWGEEDSRQQTICCERAEIVIPIELFAELKERGFSPDGDFNFTDGDKKSKKGKKDKKGGKKVEEKKTSKKVSKPVEIPDDEDEDEDEDTEIEEDEDEE